MEYEVVEKDEGSIDESYSGKICEERKKISWKMQLWARRKGNKHLMSRIIDQDISMEKELRLWWILKIKETLEIEYLEDVLICMLDVHVVTRRCHYTVPSHKEILIWCSLLFFE